MTSIRRIAIASFVAAVPAVLLAGGGAQLVPPSEFCWRSIEPDNDLQGQSPAIPESMLAAAGPNELWLARKFEDRPLLRWASGTWSAPEPIRERLGPWPESVASSPTGRVVMAAAKYRDDNETRELHVAEWTDGKWRWLGAPLISPRVRDTHAEDASFAFMGERPVVAWSEMRHVRLAGLFVAMWDGSSWRRLGSLTPAGDDRFLTPVLAVDARQQIWLAWDEDYGRTRVARWDGSAWTYVGADSLEKLSAEQGRSVRRQLSIAVDGKGRVWILRLAEKKTGAAIALARWDGAGWTAVPAPKGPEGKDETVATASMILRHDVPLVVWSQASVTDNLHLYVSEWTAGDRWIARLSGMHRLEGVSSVVYGKVAAAGGDSFFVSWDEQGKDEASTRVLQAYPCA